MADEQRDDFESKLAQYREQLGSAMKDENLRFSKLAQQHAQQIVHEAWQEAEEVIARSQEKAAEIIENSRREANELISRGQQSAADIVLAARKKADEVHAEGEKKANAAIDDSRRLAGEVGSRIEQEAREQADIILADARQQAADLVKRAGEDLTRQLREKTREQKEKLLDEARGEAEGIIAAARDNAAKEGQRVVEDLRREAQAKLEQETDSFQTYARTQAEEIRSDTEKRAAKLLRALDDDSRKVNGFLADSLKKYETMLAKFKEEAQAEVGEIAKKVTAARKDIETRLGSYNADNEQEDRTQSLVKPAGSSLWITLGGPMSGQGLNLYQGRIDLKTLSVVDHRKVRSLKTFLTRVQNIKYIGESSNDEGTVLSFEITEPMPLLEILDNIPDIITSEKTGNNIKLTLN